MSVRPHHILSILSMALIALLATVCGCSKKTVRPEELQTWLRESGMVDSVTVGSFHWTCAYRPLALRALAAGQSIPTSERTIQCVLTVEKIAGRNGGDVIFDGVGSEEEFNMRVRDVAFQYGDRIALVSDRGTIRCLGAELMYDVGLSRKKSLLLTFPISEKELADMQDVRVVVDEQVFVKSPIEFHLDTQELAHMPEVVR